MEENDSKVLFTNTYTTNEQTDRQLYLRVRRLPRLILFIGSTVMIAFVVYWFVGLVQWSKATGKPLFAESSAWINILAVVLYAALIVRELLGPRIFAKRESKRLKEMYRSEHVTIDTRFTNDAFDIHNRMSNAEMHISYDAPKQVFETKDLFLIKTKQRQLLILAKDGFYGVDATGFRRFMEEKCPDASLKWRKNA